ncbi:MAG TPA: NADH-quinone oxidoreductase subunit L [Candidatus Dadabacteria bacterium]|nr:NADH-quinone oxidoreductase subunit L [Candidatus Dadabacteria bacterium]
MQELIIYLSLIPILAVSLNAIFKGPKSLSFSVPSIIYLTIFSLIIILTSYGTSLAGHSFLFFSINESKISLDFIFDKDYLLISLIVLGISILVLAYSSKFIEFEGSTRYNRYFLFLIIFISAMFLFSISNDLLGSYIFWELLGLSSYFLIGYWNKDDEAIKSSTIAFWITRMGDLFFFGGLIIIFSEMNSLNIDYLNQNYDLFSTSTSLKFSVLCISIGILTKSAQFPFNIWLTKAMKGPTPVSSLIHSATMVVAGILLLYKISPLLGVNSFVSNLLLYIGLISTLIASIVAFTENDLKKILAYSTISHIGLMFVAVGLQNSDLGLFHLFSHSLFKSMLFLYAGVIILFKGSSDIEKLKGSIGFSSPLGIILLIGCLSLSSIYSFTGSFSKEFILYEVLRQGKYIELLILLISVFFTALYSSRLYFYITDLRFKNLSKINLKDLNWVYYSPLVILAFLSLIGFSTMDIFLKYTNGNSELSPLLEIERNIDIIYIILLQILILLTFAINFFYSSKITNSLKGISALAIDTFKLDKIYIEIYESVFKALSNFVAWFDRNIIDGLINYLPIKLLDISKGLMGLQDGTTRKYAIRMIIFFIFLILIMGAISNISSIGIHS